MISMFLGGFVGFAIACQIIVLVWFFTSRK